MPSTVYVALSAQMAADKRLATVANNIANMNTPGFRAEQVRFTELLDGPASNSTSYVGGGETFTSLKAGPINQTGNPLDVAVAGEGWLAVRTPEGVGYTRNGRLQMTPEGELRTASNLPVLDAGGAPLMINPNGGEARIGADGSITQGRKPVGRIGLFTLPKGANLVRHDGSTLLSDKPGQPVQNFTVNALRQGFVEGANVDPVMEMTRLISLQRAFEQAASAVSANEEATSSAIRQLGPTG